MQPGLPGFEDPAEPRKPAPRAGRPPRSHEAVAEPRPDPDAAALERFFAGMGRVSDATRLVYSNVWSRYAAFCAAHGRTATGAGADSIETFLATVRGKRGRAASENTRRRYLELIHRVLEAQRGAALRPDNPAEALLARVPKGERPPPVALDEAQEARLLALLTQAPEDEGWTALRNRAAALLVLGSGIRPGELVQLPLSAIVAEGDWPTVELAASRPVAARVAPISPFARETLRAWLQRRDELRIPGALAFPSRETGAAMHPATMYGYVRDFLESAGIDRRALGATVLRHSFAMRQLRAGTDGAHVQRWLGLRGPDEVARYRPLLAYPPGVDVR